MSKCYINKGFFEFVIAKHIPFESIEEDAPYLMSEDSFNSDTAEAALELAFDLYPEKPGEDEEDTIEKRHEFVSEFMEHAKCEIVKKWASNLGMITKEAAIERGNAQASEAVKFWKKKIESVKEKAYNDGWDDAVNDTLNKFRKKSAYQFSQWKLEDPIKERIPQNSEDEAWEQMMAIRERNFDV